MAARPPGPPPPWRATLLLASVGTLGAFACGLAFALAACGGGPVPWWAWGLALLAGGAHALLARAWGRYAGRVARVAWLDGRRARRA